MSNILVCDPYIGELGYETIWQALCREKALDFDFCIVATFKGRECLYDFADLVISHQFKGQSDGAWMLGVSQQSIDNFFTDNIKPVIDKEDNITRFSVRDTELFSKSNRVNYDPPMAGIYKRLTVPCQIDYTGDFDIVIHARNRPFCQERNWDKKEWHDLILRLQANHLKLAVIGTDAIGFPGCYNLLDKPLAYAVDAINRSKLVIGESSGPMHVAMLCEKPVVVWWTGQSNNMNKARYLHKWNFFKTPLTTIGTVGQVTTVDDVYPEVLKMLVTQYAEDKAG